MDYQEVIELLKSANRSNDMVGILPKSDISKIIISAMQELREYKQLGTLEELEKLKECEFSGIELAEISCGLNQLKAYQQLGTLEEVRGAVEKQCEHCGYKIHSDNISKLNSCNDCGMKTVCKKRPDYGDYCRINCYDWSEVEE